MIRKVKELYKEPFFGDIRYCKLEWTGIMPSMSGLDIFIYTCYTYMIIGENYERANKRGFKTVDPLLLQK